MKILFFGDVNGDAGMTAVERDLHRWREEHTPDLIIANAENSARSGMTPETLSRMQSAGVEFFTSGDHFMDRDYAALAGFPLIRPGNVRGTYPGDGWRVVEGANGEKAVIINLMGVQALKLPWTDPFVAIEEILQEVRAQSGDAIFLDYHTISGGETQAMAWYLDGRISAVIGTHSHVPTADERILPKGTAMQGDVGMCGAYDTVIGMQVDRGIANFQRLAGREVVSPPMLKGQPEPYFCDAVLVETVGPTVSHSIQRLTTRPNQ